jgi:hypothetical protein
MSKPRSFLVRRDAQHDGRTSHYPVGRIILNGRRGVLFLNHTETVFTVVERDDGEKADPEPGVSGPPA